MKKHFYYAMALLLFLTTSCVSEKIETQEDRASYNPETVWEYNGDIAVFKQSDSGSKKQSEQRKTGEKTPKK